MGHSTGEGGQAVRNHLLCFGLGYSARALVDRLARQGWLITGTLRSDAGAEALGASGYQGIQFDGSAPSPAIDAALTNATHVLVSAPPDDAGDPVLRHHRAALASAPNLRWIGYLSTVGVYGNHDGRLVDETTPVNPTHQRSKRRIAAERAWLDLATDSPPVRRVKVFRLAGIYGPGRSAIDAVLAGTARRIVKPGQVFNRVHVEDIARVLEASIARGGRYDIYDVADREPAPPQDVIAHAATLLGFPLPAEQPFDAVEMSPMAASFYADNRRIAARRILDDLQVDLAYPTYREGLAAILAGLRGEPRTNA